MKIEINLYDDTGERIVGKAIETDCRSLIVNGMHIIQDGGVHAEMRQLQQEQQSDNLVQMFCPDAEVPVEIN